MSPKEVLTGISGVVITYKPGVIVLTQDLTGDDLRKGDRILTYTYRGEGVSAVWFKGRFYRDYDTTFAKGLDGTGCMRNCKGGYIDAGVTVWWAKVKIGSGVVGWVNMNKAKFAGVESLAVVMPARLRRSRSFASSAALGQDDNGLVSVTRDGVLRTENREL